MLVLQDLVDVTIEEKREKEEPLEVEEAGHQEETCEAGPSVAEEDAAMSVVAEEERHDEATPDIAVGDATICVAKVPEETDMIVAFHIVAQEPEPCLAEPTLREILEVVEDSNRFARELVEDLEPTPPPPWTSNRMTELVGRVKELLNEKRRIE